MSEITQKTEDIIVYCNARIFDCWEKIRQAGITDTTKLNRMRDGMVQAATPLFLELIQKDITAQYNDYNVATDPNLNDDDPDDEVNEPEQDK